MSSKPPGPKTKHTRLRITEIELEPTTADRQISAKVLADNEVVCKLPGIKTGRHLRWTKLIVHDGPGDSKVGLEVCEKHSLKDRRFRSKVFMVSSVRAQTEVAVEFVGLAWNANFKLLTPAAAEQSFAAGLEKLREMQNVPSTLGKLGRARPVFAAMLQVGSEISEIHPAAKIVFMICTKAWEKLEEREQCDENVRELLDGLGGALDFVDLVKKHARTERLQGTIGEFLTLLEDVSIFTAERTDSISSPVRSLRGLLDSREHDKTKELLSRFERLRAELILGVGVETHQQVHMIDKKLQTMGLHSLLGQLHPVTPSGYDPSRMCQEGTREGIISNIVTWTKQATSTECMLWVHGQAGVGKSSIIASVCQRLANDNVLAASFFCKRDDPSLRDPLRLINSIAHGLATSYPPYGEAVTAAIQENRELCTAHMAIRYKGLIKEPLESLSDPSMHRPLIIVIDALDECGTENTRQSLLKHLLDISKIISWLKFIVTSRPDGDIQEFFNGLDETQVSSRNVHSFDASNDIRAYFQKELGDIARKHQWKEGSIDQLCEKAEGVFIWATTVKNYLTAFRGSTAPRLQKVLSDQKSTVTDSLDTLYRSVTLAGMNDAEEDQKALLRQCIGLIVMVSTRQPLSLSALGSLLQGQLDPLDLEEIVRNLDAVLHADARLNGAVRFYHPSFADYATDRSRSMDLYVFPEERNTELALGCLTTMERELHFNICELETSYLLNGQVPDLAERVKLKISDQLGYACTFWISHLTATPKGALTSEVEALMNSPRVLYWLEVLSLLGKVELGLQGLLELQSWLPESADALIESVEDIYKFISAFYDPISASAPHIYVSALAFAPSSAQVVRRFRNLFPNTVTVASGGDRDWPRWLRALAHPSSVKSLVVSSDGKLLVTGSREGLVRIWDVKSGTIVGEPLLGHSDGVTCVALSSDGRRIVSGSVDKTLRLWDTKTGVPVGEPLVGHSETVTCVALSPGNTSIASGSDDRTIRLWDAKTGAAIRDPLEGHLERVTSVGFSPDGKYVISSSVDRTVRIWATTTNTLSSELFIDHGGLDFATFSPDGRRVAYGSTDGLGMVKWDPDSGTIVGEPLVQRYSRGFGPLAFSPDGQRVISSGIENEIYIWDVERGSMIGQPLIGHSKFVTSMGFLPDGRQLVSGSDDKTVKLWDIRPRSDIQVSNPIAGHNRPITSVAFSPNGNRIVSSSFDMTIRLWDAKTGGPVGDQLIGHSDAISSLSFSPDGNYIVSGSLDKTLQLWDATTGALIGEPLLKHSETVDSVAFSPNGAHIAFRSSDGTGAITSVTFSSDRRQVFGSEDIIQLQDTKANDTNDPRITHPAAVYIAFSPDGSHVVSGSWETAICLWDTKTGTTMGNPFIGHSGVVYSAAFSPDASCIVSGSADNTVRLWDARLGIAIGEPLVGHFGAVTSVAFSPDGNRIVSGSFDLTVRLWDRSTGTSIGVPFVGHTEIVTTVAFSPDNSCIVSGSWDFSVRMWNANTDTESIGPKSAETSLHQNPPNTPFSWPAHTAALPPHPTDPGWVSLDGKSPLVWLPAHYRRQYSPETLYTISANPTLSTIWLDFSKFAHGLSWASVAA